MVSLSTHRHFQQVQDLPFCYVCGKDFLPDDSTDRDHVPAKKAFPCPGQGTGPLASHHSEIDEKVGQLVGVRWGKITSDPKLRLTW